MIKEAILKTVNDVNIMEIPGSILRSNVYENEYLSKVIKEHTGNNGVVLAKSFLNEDEVNELKAAGKNLAETKAAQWAPYTEGCEDFHHFDKNDEADDERRIKSGRQTRPRDFHLYKFLPWNSHSKMFTEATHSIIRLRNSLNGQPKDHTINEDSDFFSIPQLVHYHKGGNFLGEHRDIQFHVQQGVPTEAEIITLLSKKGKDFETGGLFIRLNGEKKFLEEYADPGDIVIYDVKNHHGCDPVDPDKKDDHPFDGRWIMLIPPYKKSIHLKSND